jgi:hypothetical protein
MNALTVAYRLRCQLKAVLASMPQESRPGSGTSKSHPKRCHRPAVHSAAPGVEPLAPSGLLTAAPGVEPLAPLAPPEVRSAPPCVVPLAADVSSVVPPAPFMGLAPPLAARPPQPNVSAMHNPDGKTERIMSAQGCQ